ncbi:phage minor head protein [Alkalicoccus chagannorensis]|uniref:phage minor head protein n=1 Tax=Alkalicoccus chagannorensis TaxID=427072 RepID=UPI0004085D21|nr:phage minor head protein [Alkalicoccus chagannorensis]
MHPDERAIQAFDRLQEAAQTRKKWRTLEEIEKKLQRGLKQVWSKQADAYVEELEKNQTRIDALSEGAFFVEADSDDIHNSASRASERVIDDELKEVIDTGLRAALEEGGKHLLADIDEDQPFTIQNTRAEDYISSRSATQVTRVKETTRKRIRRTLEKGMAEKKSYQALARDIKQSFSGFSGRRGQEHIRDRAELVAVTEIGEAFEEGSEVAADKIAEKGIHLEKAWQTSEDARVSDGCLDNQNQGWIPNDQDFQSGHMHPLRFPGCRCTCLRRRKRG